jgi:two-component system sensor histidine kinase TctE
MATIQVAETLELRHSLARQVLLDTLWRQALLVALIAAVVVWVVQRATRPVRALSAQVQAREPDDLAPMDAGPLPRELAPLVEATNQALARVADLVAHQKRFVRDVSHQLRTPLAVLKAQVQSARRGDVPPAQAFSEIERTVDGATRLANQMLALAKLEQLRQDGEPPLLDWAEVVREVALDMAPLVAQRELDFSLDLQPLPVRGHAWALRELVRNLMHNAVQHSPRGGTLALCGQRQGGLALLTVADSGPGLSEAQRERLFHPFAPAAAGPAVAPAQADPPSSGTGLGLAICADVVASHGGRIALEPRPEGGLAARVWLPLADNHAP